MAALHPSPGGPLDLQDAWVPVADVHCRTCKGTGVQMKLSARIWARLRYGAGEDY